MLTRIDRFRLSPLRFCSAGRLPQGTGATRTASDGTRKLPSAPPIRAARSISAWRFSSEGCGAPCYVRGRRPGRIFAAQQSFDSPSVPADHYGGEEPAGIMAKDRRAARYCTRAVWAEENSERVNECCGLLRPSPAKSIGVEPGAAEARIHRRYKPIP